MLVRAGVDIPTVKILMGHADITTTMRYAHIANSHVIEAGKRVGGFTAKGRTNIGHEPNSKVIDLGGSG